MRVVNHQPQHSNRTKKCKVVIVVPIHKQHLQPGQYHLITPSQTIIHIAETPLAHILFPPDTGHSQQPTHPPPHQLIIQAQQHIHQLHKHILTCTYAPTYSSSWLNRFAHDFTYRMVCWLSYLFPTHIADRI